MLRFLRGFQIFCVVVGIVSGFAYSFLPQLAENFQKGLSPDFRNVRNGWDVSLLAGMFLGFTIAGLLQLHLPKKEEEAGRVPEATADYISNNHIIVEMPRTAGRYGK